MFRKRLFYGNSAIRPITNVHERGRGIPPIPRRLVEECLSFSVADLKSRLGRKALLAASQDAHPVRFPAGGVWLSAYITYEPHRLPGRRTRWSDIDQGNVRLWLVCLKCHRRVRKLYCFPADTGGDDLSDLSCRRCHGLTYKSQNCSGNRWWKEIVRPLKRLHRRRKRLLGRKQNTQTMTQLGRIDELIWILHRRAAPKTRSKRRNDNVDPGNSLRVRRPYKDLRLLESQ